MRVGNNNTTKASLGAVLAVALVLGAVPAVAQRIICPPATRPRNPSPPPRVAASDCLMRELREFVRNEESRRTLVLEQGKSYWFSASGCPKTGNIGLYIFEGPDGNGKPLKEDSNYAPSFCFTPQATGKYTVKVKALSLMRSYQSGTIDACFAESRCQ